MFILAASYIGAGFLICAGCLPALALVQRQGVRRPDRYFGAADESAAVLEVDFLPAPALEIRKRRGM